MPSSIAMSTRAARGLASCACILICAALPPRADADANDHDDLSAELIAAKIVRTDAFAWDGARTHVRMVLIEPAGDKHERAMDLLGRRKDGQFQTLLRFTAPPDIAGTAFLMLGHGHDQSEQYIYLPGLKRTRRIVGREREGSFMGSDFSYADMQRVDSRQAEHKRLPDEKFGNDEVYVIESTVNADAPIPYAKLTTWIRKSDFIALRTRFFDKAGQLLKTLYSRRVREIEGKPVVVEARMQNQQTNHVTDLFIDSVERKGDLDAADFTPAALEHM